MDIEALRAKYAAAYDSDFEMPAEDSEEETTEYEDSSEEEEESEGNLNLLCKFLLSILNTCCIN